MSVNNVYLKAQLHDIKTLRPNMKASISNNFKSIKHIGFRSHTSFHTCNSWIPCEIRYQILKIGEVFAPPQQKFNDRKQSQITTKIVIFWHMRRLQYSLKAVKIWIHFIQSSEFKWRKTKKWHFFRNSGMSKIVDGFL